MLPSHLAKYSSAASDLSSIRGSRRGSPLWFKQCGGHRPPDLGVGRQGREPRRDVAQEGVPGRDRHRGGRQDDHLHNDQSSFRVRNGGGDHPKELHPASFRRSCNRKYSEREQEPSTHRRSNGRSDDQVLAFLWR
jgi:hypothetical protein